MRRSRARSGAPPSRAPSPARRRPVHMRFGGDGVQILRLAPPEGATGRVDRVLYQRPALDPPDLLGTAGSFRPHCHAQVGNQTVACARGEWVFPRAAAGGEQGDEGDGELAGGHTPSCRRPGAGMPQPCYRHRDQEPLVVARPAQVTVRRSNSASRPFAGRLQPRRARVAVLSVAFGAVPAIYLLRAGRRSDDERSNAPSRRCARSGASARRWVTSSRSS
jgi:hypothetical protein